MIAWIAALESELHAVTEQMTDATVQKIGPIEIWTGTINNEKVCAALCGVGKVSAAITSTIIIQSLKPEAIINIGVGGGLEPSQNVGEWIFSTEAIQADFDTSALDGPSGLGKVYAADEKLLAKALRIADELDLKEWTGQIATQDLFMAREEDYEKLLKNFPGALVSEMEGGAVAQTAMTFGVPFLIVRVLSDLAFEEENPISFSRLEKQTARQLHSFVARWYRDEPLDE